MLAVPARTPRSFAGDTDAPLADFLSSFARSLAQSQERQASVQRITNAILDKCCARAVFDMGGFTKLPRDTIFNLLADVERETEGTNAGALAHWLVSFEDVLSTCFPVPAPLPPVPPVAHDYSKVPDSADAVPIADSGHIHQRKAIYGVDEKNGLGAILLSKNEMPRFTREMFTKLVTANPELETIVEPEVVHMIDTVYEFTFCKYGVINYDKVYRDHCGRELRRIAPHLPDKGKTKGDSRSFSDMLKWRAGNTRKTSSKTSSTGYKKGFTVDKINCCETAIKLMEEQKFPVMLLDNGEVEKKFDISAETLKEKPLPPRPLPYTGPSGPYPIAMAMPMPEGSPLFLSKVTGVPFFGGAGIQLPPGAPVQGPLAPVTASACNQDRKTETTNRDNGKKGKRGGHPHLDADLSMSAPPPKKPKPAVPKPERTEPVENFKKSGLPLRALPRAELTKGQEVVLFVDDEYWYGKVSLVTKTTGTWIKFYDLEEGGSFISEEKHMLPPDEYYDRWMLVAA